MRPWAQKARHHPSSREGDHNQTEGGAHGGFNPWRIYTSSQVFSTEHLKRRGEGGGGGGGGGGGIANQRTPFPRAQPQAVGAVCACVFPPLEKIPPGALIRMRRSAPAAAAPQPAAAVATAALRCSPLRSACPRRRACGSESADMRRDQSLGQHPAPAYPQAHRCQSGRRSHENFSLAAAVASAAISAYLRRGRRRVGGWRRSVQASCSRRSPATSTAVPSAPGSVRCLRPPPAAAALDAGSRV